MVDKNYDNQDIEMETVTVKDTGMVPSKAGEIGKDLSSANQKNRTRSPITYNKGQF